MNLDIQVNLDCVDSPEHRDPLGQREILGAPVSMAPLENRVQLEEMGRLDFRVRKETKVNSSSHLNVLGQRERKEAQDFRADLVCLGQKAHQEIGACLGRLGCLGQRVCGVRWVSMVWMVCEALLELLVAKVSLARCSVDRRVLVVTWDFLVDGASLETPE